jgi:ferredoxin/flavodoxin---NADP+ reductase
VTATDTLQPGSPAATGREVHVDLLVVGAGPAGLGSVSPHKAQAVVAALGFTADIGPLETWGIEIADRKVLVDTAMRTNVPGVYSAGDITEYGGKVRLIAVGFGEAATAVNNAATYLDPDQPLFPGHSSDDPAGIGAGAHA